MEVVALKRFAWERPRGADGAAGRWRDPARPRRSTASAMALRDLAAVGLGGKPSPDHRVDLWIPVISVKSDHLSVGGDTRKRQTMMFDAPPHSGHRSSCFGSKTFLASAMNRVISSRGNSTGTSIEPLKEVALADVAWSRPRVGQSGVQCLRPMLTLPLRLARKERSNGALPDATFTTCTA